MSDDLSVDFSLEENPNGDDQSSTPILLSLSEEQQDSTSITYNETGDALASSPIYKSDPLKVLGEAAKGMSDDAFAADLAAILEGNKVYDPEQKQLVGKEKVDDEFMKKLKEADSQRSSSGEENKAATGTDGKEKEDQNAIFEKIAKNMNFANSFDLGEFEMEKRFESFDKDLSAGTLPNFPAPTMPPIPELPNLPLPPNPLDTLKEALPFSTEDFIKDLSLINVQSEALDVVKQDKNWPAVPTNLTQPSAERTKSMFGSFEYEAVAGSDSCAINIKGTWETDNISTVDIPQLNGKINGTTGKQITKGTIRFNKKAVNQLQALWKEWETAGLLDRVLTYDGAFVPRFIKTKTGCSTSLSNHAWGTAFDINAAWNARGDEPALKGQKGTTRELVEIANKHGFYWGGHFDTKDGMHFEVAKILP
jgi:hypothetical protein